MSWMIGVDVGGTFTDFFAFDDATGRVVLHKTPSTPENPATAILDGLHDLITRHEIPVDAIGRLAHGTTVATNALIQKQGGRLALIVTKGFRDLIEIGRQIRPKLFDLQTDYPVPLVAREYRIEVDERITAGGTVLRTLSEAEISKVLEEVKKISPDACAICLLFSFLNPRHETRLAEALAEACPGLPISISSEVHPEFREYERLSTTVLNAYLHSVMDHYLASLQAGMYRLAPQALLGINQSSGGVMSLERARRFPIRTALSGPAAGAMGAIHIARLSNVPDVISLDMGGTSADVTLIRDFKAGIEYNRWVEGYPVRLASVDITAVGAGGGSIAWFDRDGLMKVGPQSAGAVPGPACYMRGGDKPTVTDANLVLGRLSPRGLISGAMRLDRSAAISAITPLAQRLGFSIERTALGIVDIVVANMVRAIRTVSVERGIDPRRFTLLPFGGAGPLHATTVARTLGISRILVPLAPGILCAQGLIVSDLREHFVRTAIMRLDPKRGERLVKIITDLTVDAEQWFESEEVEPADRQISISFDMRYVGQNFELSVAYERDIESLDRIDGDKLRSAFFREHERSYGFFNPDDPIEIVNVRLTAIGQHKKPNAPLGRPMTDAPRPFENRPVWFQNDSPVTTSVFKRDDLSVGHSITGPAIVEQLDATTVLHPGDRAIIDSALNMYVEVNQ
jgi:N-methylhydantoinase A